MVDVVSAQQTEGNLTASQEGFLLLLIWDRVMSMEPGATRGPFDYVKKADRADKLIGTATAQESIRWKMDAQEWRESGVIEIDATGKYACSAGTFQGSFYIDTAPIPPTLDPSDPNFGKLQAWTTLVQHDTPVFTAGAREGSWALRLEMHAVATVSATYNQLTKVTFTHEPMILSNPRADNIQVAHYRTSQAINLAFLMRLRFSAAVAAGKTFTLDAARAGFRNQRDGV